ncbi:MAG: flagellar basal-body rod protein FlgF, partial [Alphaproteobacteria bacterium]|nr:flagellar basal-body rod protein FlgF [Alphaproteobacteria bacterium]
ESPVYVLLSQQEALQRQMDIVAQNIANVNTTGYKSNDVLFQDFLVKPDSKNTHHMVLDRATLRNTTQGSFTKTDNPLDIAISGQGYFAVQTPQGTQYTRQGTFQVDAEGNIVTADGYPILSGGGSTIAVPTNAKSVEIGLDGTISTETGKVGRLQVVKFKNEQLMKQTYGGFYKTDEAAEVDEEAQLHQGMVEASNVKSVQEMTHVLEISRAYERVAHLIDAENQRLTNAIRSLGKVA